MPEIAPTLLPDALAVFPLDGALLLPRGVLPLNIFEPRYLNMIDDVMAGDRLLGLIQTAGGGSAHPQLAPVGCVAKVSSYAETSDGRYLISLSGVIRFRWKSEIAARTPYRLVRPDYAEFLHDLEPLSGISAHPDRRRLQEALQKYLARRGMQVDLESAETTPFEGLVTGLCISLPFGPAEKQALIEAIDFQARLDALTALLEIDTENPEGEGPSALQ